MRNPSRVRNGSRPVTRACASAKEASGETGRRGSLIRGGRRPRQGRDIGKHLGKAARFAAENIMLAELALLQRSQMARRDIIDMDKIEPRVDIAGHAARKPPRQ